MDVELKDHYDVIVYGTGKKTQDCLSLDCFRWIGFTVMFSVMHNNNNS